MQRIRHDLDFVRFNRQLALALVALMIFADESCAMSTPPDPVVITAADVGQIVSLAIGQRLTVKLNAQPGTGFGWEIDATSTSLLSLSNTMQGGASLPGGVETQILTFVARSAGEGDLKVIYRRPWEKGATPAKSLSIKIKITAQ